MIRVRRVSAGEARRARLKASGLAQSASVDQRSLALASRINISAQAITSSLAELHGGRWNTHIDHEVGLVVISRDWDARES